MDIPGLEYSSDPAALASCDVTVRKSTFLLSNDDIYTLGHYSNDLMTIWNILVMANRCAR